MVHFTGGLRRRRRLLFFPRGPYHSIRRNRSRLVRVKRLSHDGQPTLVLVCRVGRRGPADFDRNTVLPTGVDGVDGEERFRAERHRYWIHRRVRDGRCVATVDRQVFLCATVAGGFQSMGRIRNRRESGGDLVRARARRAAGSRADREETSFIRRPIA